MDKLSCCMKYNAQREVYWLNSENSTLDHGGIFFLTFCCIAASQNLLNFYQVNPRPSSHQGNQIQSITW